MGLGSEWYEGRWLCLLYSVHFVRVPSPQAAIAGKLSRILILSEIQEVVCRVGPVCNEKVAFEMNDGIDIGERL